MRTAVTTPHTSITPKRRPLATLALTALCAALLAGCASKGAPPALYDFGPLPVVASTTNASLPPLAVADATGPSWLDNERMYYRLLYADAQQARPYAQNRWNGPPLQLLTQRLKARIAGAGVQVLSASDAAVGVDLLRIEVDDFSQDFTSADQSRGHLALRASLMRGHRLIAQMTFNGSVSATSADAPGGARALAAASDAVAADILSWLATVPRPPSQ
jgi:cholesterol transport system auxiliary component